MLSKLSRNVGSTLRTPILQQQRGFAKVLCVLYDDPVDGYPTSYARGSVPNVTHYPNQFGKPGDTAPTPKNPVTKPGEVPKLLGSVTGGLGIRDWLEKNGHELVVTSDKDGDGCEVEKHLPDTEVIISQPFWPCYMTRKRIEMAPKLKMCLTAGIGSDHIDLEAACERNLTVAEVTYCNSISVSEHVVMMILGLVRNYIPSYNQVIAGGWNIADCVKRSYDLEQMHVGTVASGRIGLAVLRRLAPFDCKLHYVDRHRLPGEVEKELNLTHHETVEDMVKVCDVVTINCPLHPGTEHLFNEEMIFKHMKKGSYIVNTARGKICDRDVVAKALESGHLAGYAGDVWFPQPPPKDHPWRTMPHHAMTPHISGTSLSAQQRYSNGVQEILECHFSGEKIRDEYIIAQNGGLAGTGAQSYSAGNATGGSDESAKFKQQK